MKLTNQLRMAAIRAQRDGVESVAQVMGSTAQKFNIRLVPIDALITGPIGQNVGIGMPTVWVSRADYVPGPHVILGHRALLNTYGTRTTEQAQEEVEMMEALMAEQDAAEAAAGREVADA